MSKEIDIEYYHQLALQKQKEHRKILANLKKKPPKNLDKQPSRFTRKSLRRLIVRPVPTVARHWGLTLKKRILHESPSILR